MSFFRNLFESNDARKMRQIIKSSKIETAPISSVGAAIVIATIASGTNLDQFIKRPNDKEVQECRFIVNTEFLYFFLFMTIREIFTLSIDSLRKKHLSDLLIASSIQSLVNAMCGNWPEAMKEKIRNEMNDNLSAAHKEFVAILKSIEDQECQVSALFNQLAESIAQILKNEDKPTIIPTIISTAIDNMDKAKLLDLIHNLK